MVKHLFLILVLLVTGVVNCFAGDSETDEQRAAAAAEMIRLIETNSWVFIPDDVLLPDGIRICDLRSDANNFVMKDSVLTTHLNFTSGRITYPSGAIPRYATSIQPMQATMAVTNQETKATKNNKSVICTIDYDIVETNYNERRSHGRIELHIDTRNGVTTMSSHGLRYDETYTGKLMEIIKF